MINAILQKSYKTSIYQKSTQRMSAGSKKTMLYLIEPARSFNEYFSLLRNQLKKWKIPYGQEYGLGSIKQIMLDQKYHNIVIINNAELQQKDYPRDIHETKDLQIYCYPFQNSRFSSLNSPGEVVKKYQYSYTTDSQRQMLNLDNKIQKSLDNKISMKSLKKQRKISARRPYEKIYLLKQYNSSPQYKRFCQLLENEREIYKIQGFNQFANAHKYRRCLAITQAKGLYQLNKYLNNERLSKRVDIAALGFDKNVVLQQDLKNVMLISQSPRDILCYIQDSGNQLNSAVPTYVQQMRNAVITNQAAGTNIEGSKLSGSNINSTSIIKNQPIIKSNKQIGNNNVVNGSTRQSSKNLVHYPLKGGKAGSQTETNLISGKNMPITTNKSVSSKDLLHHGTSNTKNSTSQNTQRIAHKTVDYNAKKSQSVHTKQRRKSSSSNSSDSKSKHRKGKKIAKGLTIAKGQAKTIEKSNVLSSKQESNSFSKTKYLIKSDQHISEKEIHKPKKAYGVRESQIIHEQSAEYDPSTRKYTDSHQRFTQVYGSIDDPVYLNSQIGVVKGRQASQPVFYQQSKDSLPKNIVKSHQVVTNNSRVSPQVYEYKQDSKKNVENNKQIITSYNFGQYTINTIERPSSASSYEQQKTPTYKSKTIEHSQSKEKQQQYMHKNSNTRVIVNDSIDHKPIITPLSNTQNKFTFNPSHTSNEVVQHIYKESARIEQPNGNYRNVNSSPYNNNILIKSKDLDLTKYDRVVNQNGTVVYIPKDRSLPHPIASITYKDHTKYQHKYDQAFSIHNINHQEIDKQEFNRQSQLRINKTEYNPISYSNNKNMTQAIYSQPSNNINYRSSYNNDQQIASNLRKSHISNSKIHEQVKNNYVFTNRINGYDQLESAAREYQHLHTDTSVFHFIIEHGHPQYKFIQDRVASLRDKVDICQSVSQIQSKIHTKALPNEMYDVGFIFLRENYRQVGSSRYYDTNYTMNRNIDMKPGYYLVDIDPNNRQIEIDKLRNMLRLSQIDNMGLALKMILASIVSSDKSYSKIKNTRKLGDTKTNMQTSNSRYIINQPASSNYVLNNNVSPAQYGNKIYLHKYLNSQLSDRIHQRYPHYQVTLFDSVKQLIPDKKTTVVMHAETDYIGEELGVRDYDAVYIVKPCTRRIPAGVAVIDQNDLLEVI